jgi:hypothetical protein
MIRLRRPSQNLPDRSLSDSSAWGGSRLRKLRRRYRCRRRHRHRRYFFHSVNIGARTAVNSAHNMTQ